MPSNGKADHFEGWKREFTPKKVAITDLILDGDLVLEFEEALAELKKAKDVPEGQALLGTTSDLQARVDQLQEQINSKRHSLVVHSIGRRAWRDLVEDHRYVPAKDKDDEEEPETVYSPFITTILATSGLRVDSMSFLPALLAASTVEIDGEPAEMSLDFAEWIFEVVADDERARLLTSCLEANQFTRRPPKVVTEKVQSGATKSTRP